MLKKNGVWKKNFIQIEFLKIQIKSPFSATNLNSHLISVNIPPNPFQTLLLNIKLNFPLRKKNMAAKQNGVRKKKN